MRVGEPAVPVRADGDWLTALAGTGRDHDHAVADLHALLLRVAHREAHRRAVRLGLSGPEVGDLAGQATSDAVVSILAKLPDFRGESRFTTWAYRFVVLNVGVAVNRHVWWRQRPVADGTAWEELPDRFGWGPEQQAEHGALLAALRRIVKQDLSERQRRVFVAIVVQGMPVDALAAQEGSSRNTLYKVMFDARRKIRDRLVADGLIAADGLTTGRSSERRPG